MRIEKSPINGLIQTPNFSVMRLRLNCCATTTAFALRASSSEGIESSFDCNPFNCTFYSFLQEESAIWLTANASPVNESNAVENDDDDSGKVVDEKLYLDGTKVSFATFELKTSSVSVCIIDDCKDADVPLLDFTMNHLHLSHKVTGAGRASASFSGEINVAFFYCSNFIRCYLFQCSFFKMV